MMIDSVLGICIRLLFVLIGVHYLCDFPLQGDFLAAAKNKNNPMPKISWRHCLFAHSFIHALGVYLVTRSLLLGLVELLLHIEIDRSKSDYTISFRTDQWLHILCKICYVVIIFEWNQIT